MDLFGCVSLLSAERVPSFPVIFFFVTFYPQNKTNFFFFESFSSRLLEKGKTLVHLAVVTLGNVVVVSSAVHCSSTSRSSHNTNNLINNS